MEQNIQYIWIKEDSPYFEKEKELRYQTLRKPHGFPRETALDDMEDQNEHLLALLGDEVIGCSRLRIDEDKQAIITQVAIREDLQGKGMGKAMMQEAISRAKAQRARKISLVSRESKLGFYEKLGFAVISESFPYGITQIAHRRMELIL